jgi:hypothetical protein
MFLVRKDWITPSGTHIYICNICTQLRTMRCSRTLYHIRNPMAAVAKLFHYVDSKQNRKGAHELGHVIFVLFQGVAVSV